MKSWWGSFAEPGGAALVALAGQVARPRRTARA
jgi:hypothetical protein